MRIFIGITIVIFAVFISCQEVVDANKLLETEEKVYIAGFLSPNDTVLRINVSKALPAIGTPLPVQDDEAFREKFLIKNALVQLSDEQGNKTTLTYVDSLETYLTDASTLSIESEKEYFLEVTINDKNYNASCLIPKKIDVIDYEINPTTNQFDDLLADIQFRFEDISNQNNFYITGGKVRATYTEDGVEPQEYTYPFYLDSDQFLNDNLEDGGTLSGKGNVFIRNNSNEGFTEIEVTIQVAHVEEIIFQYMRTEDLNFDADGNPFVEYSIAPTNFLDEGAVGIFAGYQVTEKVIEVDIE